MYDIIHTDAYVLSEKEDGEASKVFLMFTREFGIVSIHAQSIRKQTSKLKSLLQPYTYVFVDIVVGKKIKRVTSVISHESFSQIFLDKTKKSTYHDTLILLSKLIPRNTHVPEIFTLYHHFIKTLKIVSSKTDIKKIECVFLWLFLYNLGYISTGDSLVTLESLKGNEHIEPQTIKQMAKQINNILNTIHL